MYLPYHAGSVRNTKQQHIASLPILLLLQKPILGRTCACTINALPLYRN